MNLTCLVCVLPDDVVVGVGVVDVGVGVDGCVVDGGVDVDGGVVGVYIETDTNLRL